MKTNIIIGGIIGASLLALGALMMDAWHRAEDFREWADSISERVTTNEAGILENAVNIGKLQSEVRGRTLVFDATRGREPKNDAERRKRAQEDAALRERDEEARAAIELGELHRKMELAMLKAITCNAQVDAADPKGVLDNNTRASATVACMAAAIDDLMPPGMTVDSVVK